MQKIVLKYSKTWNQYQSIEPVRKPIWILEHILENMKFGSNQFYIEWATTGPETDELIGNCTVIKKQFNTILMGSLFPNRKDGGPYFKLLIPEFVKLLIEWEKLVKTDTQTITITKENNTIFVRDESAKPEQSIQEIPE